jgi:hypothetical protein
MTKERFYPNEGAARFVFLKAKHGIKHSSFEMLRIIINSV